MSSCKIFYDSEHVNWEINHDYIYNTLIGNKIKNQYNGLLYLNVETAGIIEFKDNSCFISSKNEKICNKKISTKLQFKKGSVDTVMTPLAVVNFHTHPLNCYIDAETIWGWPSGEDLGQCFNFAKDNNLTHIIFAVEGTYIIDINKKILNYLLSNKKLFNLVKKNIEEIFKLTHKHRMFKNEKNALVTLNDEFYNLFLKPLKFKSQYNIMLSWLYLGNNLTLQNLVILSNQFSEYFKEIKKINIELFDTRLLNINIFHIQFFKNKTEQWSNKYSDEDLFKHFTINKKTLKIEIPNVIKYTAPFISEKCKL